VAAKTKPTDVSFDDLTIDLDRETKGLTDCLSRGDIEASTHLARLVEADAMGALGPFARALCARLCDHLQRYATLGIIEPEKALKNQVYHLMKSAARDWDSFRQH
jgi:hypothetical protein